MAAALLEIDKSQASLLEARNRYRPVAQRAAMLFFLVKDLTKLEYVYQFPLKWFVDVFESVLRSRDIKLANPDPVIDLTERLTTTVY